ncbi:MAG: hydrogenase maturation nickel metallochaperone HypA [Candidatus Omnitrophica bacterium]|nr:hydrogenase maturation nickel metallochaperone HypA [Candidatus Omnitrophota bacterium]
MHEGQFTEKIVEVVLGELKKHPGNKIKTVKVKVGDVYHLVLESVLMHFDIVVKGTPLEGVRLDLEEEPLRVCCEQCHRSGPVEDHHMPTCSFCNSLSVKTVSGNAITVESIQFEK